MMGTKLPMMCSRLCDISIVSAARVVSTSSIRYYSSSRKHPIVRNPPRFVLPCLHNTHLVANDLGVSRNTHHLHYCSSLRSHLGKGLCVPESVTHSCKPRQKHKSTAGITTRSFAASQQYVEAYRQTMENTKLLTKEEYSDFSAVFSELVRDIIDDPELRDMPETNEWVAKLLNYNVPYGKQNRALLCASAYRYLAKDLNEENVRLSYILGWCVEMLQAFFLVMDDIMDDSETRRGRPCWYKVDNNGLIACNDGIIIENCIYRLLKKHFSTKPYYANVLDIFHDVTFKTAYGQSLDTRTGTQKNFDTYSFELYSSIVKYKTSYYTFCLPVSLAMVMAGISDPEILEQAEAITLEMGHFFQVQDDYLDAFGDVKVTGKIGTDIQDGKCSWLIVMALQHANPEQRSLLLENYGINDPQKITKVKECYRALRLEDLYNSYEEQTYNLITSHLQHLSPGLPKKLFEDMLAKIYRRSS